MLDSVILVIITLLTEISSLTSSTSELSKIIQAIINLLPTLEKEYQSLVGPVKNIIAAFSANPQSTAAQLAAAAAQDAPTDTAFENAVSAYNAANPTAPIVVAATPAASS